MAFFLNDTATTESYTLPQHDALPICGKARGSAGQAKSEMAAAVSFRIATAVRRPASAGGAAPGRTADRKSTRLNSSHKPISYADVCLKKKIMGK